jgi:tetratricopeptide (TPR) repeat protein
LHLDHGNVLEKLGRTADAEKAYRRMVELCEKLAVDFPTIPVFHQVTFDHRLGLGQFLVQIGRPQEAQLVYGQAVAQPFFSQAASLSRQGLVRSHIELGRLLATSGKAQEAEAAYRDAVAIEEKLDAEHGDKPEYRREVAASHMEAAWLLRVDHRHAAHAERFYRLALEHYRKLAAESPTSQQARQDLASALFALADHYRWLPGWLNDAETTFRQALEQYEKLAADFPNVSDLPIALADCRERLASVLLFQGRHKEAEQGFREALAPAERLFETHPDNLTLQTTLGGGSRHRAVVLMRLGRTQEADKSFRRALAIQEQMVANSPNEDGYKFELGITCLDYSVLLARDRKESKPAEERYRRGSALLEKLAAEHPAILLYHARLAEGDREWASFLQDSGRTEEAKKVLDQAIASFARAVELRSNDIWYPLSRHHIELGRVLEQAGRTQEAKAAFRQAVTLQEKLEAEYGSKPEYRRELARSHRDVAGLLWVDREAQEKVYRLALKHYVRLAAASPTSEQARQDLASTLFALADYYRWAPGRLKYAEKTFRQALEQYEKLAADFPNVPAYRITLADCGERLGSVLLFQGSLQEAEQVLTEALALAERLAASHPADLTNRTTLALASRHRGEALRRLGRTKEAEKPFRRALAIQEKMVADFPDQAGCRMELGFTCQDFVVLLARDLKEPQAAEEWYRQGVALFEKLAAEHPREVLYVARLAEGHREWAFSLQDRGRAQEAKQLMDLAITNFARAVELRSNYIGGIWYPLALLYLNAGRTTEYRALCATLLERFGDATDPAFAGPAVAICKLAPDAVADLSRPVRMAEKLVALEPDRADFAGDLGKTLYRKGDLEAAVRHLEASSPAPSGFGLSQRKLFLAMAHHRLGRAAEARRLLQQSVEWIEKNGHEKLAKGADLKEPLWWPLRLELDLLRREAEELLGKK